MPATIQDHDCAELLLLEEAVRNGEGDALRARWQSGQRLLALRQGGKFRRGAAAALAKTLNIDRSELTARVKLRRMHDRRRTDYGH